MASLRDLENDSFGDKTNPLTLFRVYQDSIRQQIPNLMAIVSSFPADPQRPLFMLVRMVPYSPKDNPYYFTGGRPIYRSIRFSIENLFSLMEAIANPFKTFFYRTSNIDYSDFLILLDNEASTKEKNGVVHEVTHIGFFTTPYQRMQMIKQQEGTYGSAIFKAFDSVYDFDPNEGVHRTVRKGLFLPYVFNYDKIDEDTDTARTWKYWIENKNTWLKRFQIPFGQEGVYKEEDGNPIASIEFVIPCLLYALSDQITTPQYKALEDAKIIYGVGTKTKDFKDFLLKNNYYIVIYRVQPVGDSFKINNDKYPKGVTPKDGRKSIRLMFWEGHWMRADGPDDTKVLRYLEYAKREGYIRQLNAYEFAERYHNYSFDKMIKFNQDNFIRTHNTGYEFSEFNYEKMTYKDKHIPKYVYFADFEASTDEEYHRPYLVCLKGMEITKEQGQLTYRPLYPDVYFWGPNCAQKMLDYFAALYGNAYNRSTRFNQPNVRVYFYNLHYDLTFIQPYLKHINKIMKGNTLYSTQGRYKCYNNVTSEYRQVLIDFWDALPIFKSTLKKATEDYLTPEQKRTIKKEVFPYELYTYDFFDKHPSGFCSIVEFFDAFHDREKAKKEINQEVFTSMIKEDKINYKEYAIFYCRQDVNCLSQIMINFADLLSGKHVEGINGVLPFSICLWKFRTASSIGYEYFKKTVMLSKNNNDYIPKHDWYLPKSSLRHLIQRSIRGGRVMTRDNQKFYYKALNDNELLQDYDGVSLYPSAMSLLWLTEGNAKLIKGEYTHEDILKLFAHPESSPEEANDFQFKDGCIHVTYINTRKDRHFPLLCIKDEKTNLNEYRNFHEEEVNTWVNVIDIFNLIDFQNAEIKWDAAIVWEGSRYYEIRESITKLFQFRADNKKHPIQMVIKLILNSIFGKSILKPQDKETVIVEKTGYRYNNDLGGFEEVDSWGEYFDANAYRIHKFEELEGNLMEVQIYRRDVSSSFNIFGSNVLAMARRIIGRVMALAEDLEEQYPELSPGLFYTDTDSMHIRNDLLQKLEIAYREKYGKEIKGNQLTQFHIDFDPPKSFAEGEVVKGAVESYFLMKKVYADKLVGDKGSVDYHMRLKGIPIDLVKYEDYEKIFNNESITYNLLDGHTSFFYKNGKVGSRLSMTREIMTKEAKLKRKEENIILDENKRSRTD